MIPQGRVNKQMDGLSSRKSRRREENFTLRNVVSQINLAGEKKKGIVTNDVKKAAILETLHQASLHDVSSWGEVRDSNQVVFEMKSMRKSLQNQLKHDSHKTPEGNLRKLPTRKQPASEQGCSATSSGRISNISSHTGVVLKRNENEKKYCKKESRGRSTNMKQQTTNRQNEFTKNVYSRHLTSPTPCITVENSAKDFTEIDFEKSSLSAENEKESQRRESANEIKLDNSDLTEDLFFSASDARIDTLSPTPEDISLKEKEVLNKFTDPQLKESLQNIIKRRRSSVRFVKSDSVYDMTNLEKTISEQLEETADQYEQQLAENESAIEEAQSSESRSVKSASSRRVSANRERLASAGTMTSERSPAEVTHRQPHTSSRKTGRQEQRVSAARRISSARSCISTASNLTQRSVSSPILRRRRPELHTEETRVIRPATAKGYVPNLTNRKISRNQSAVSCPDISKRSDEAKNLAQVKMIREFLLMYAKVIEKNDDALPRGGPVRMMSQTPEFVIKSAIGQFLTRAFPSGESSEWTGPSATTKKERYEEQQRSKLLRIKVCMKHLASVA